MKRSSILLSLLSAAALATPAFAGSVTVKGSDTMVILAQKWAEIYMSKNPDTKIQVTGGGSGIGLAALQNNTTDIANSSRPIRSTERAAAIRTFGKNPREYKVALDGLSIYVNTENSLKEISTAQLKEVFTGKVRNWKELGGNDAPITVYSRENSSGTYEFFKEHILKGADFVSSAQTMPGTAAVLQAVANDKNGIGYGGAAYGQGAKHLSVKEDTGPAIEPNEETVLSGKYPISRYLFMYLNPEKDKGEIASFLNWIRSDTGQAIVKDVGYYPLPPALREK